MTGYELLRGEDPNWIPEESGEVDEDYRWAVKTTLDNLAFRANLLFWLTLALAIGSTVIIATAGTPHGPPLDVTMPWALVLASASFSIPLALSLSPSALSSASSAADVHHHVGLYLASGLAMIGYALNVSVLFASLDSEARQRTHRSVAVITGVALLLFTVLFVAGIDWGAEPSDRLAGQSSAQPAQSTAMQLAHP